MNSDAPTVDAYLAGLPEGRGAAISTVRDVINEHLPEGYVEQMDWGMISWVVPLETNPDTYNGKPLCYAALASQKHYMSVYLLGFYTDGPELEWFRTQYADRGIKLDMGRSCIRFRRVEDLALDLLGDAVAMIPLDEFIARSELARGAR